MGTLPPKNGRPAVPLGQNRLSILAQPAARRLQIGFESHIAGASAAIRQIGRTVDMLNELKVFVRAVELKSISAAADSRKFRAAAEMLFSSTARTKTLSSFSMAAVLPISQIARLAPAI